MNKILFLVIAMCWQSVMVLAQTVKQATVSADSAFTDCIRMEKDAKDTDLQVMLQFDEQNNQLVISLISYRTLFVFEDNVRYQKVIKRRRLHPERLPYVAIYTDKQRFKLSKSLKKSFAKPRKKHVFFRWLNYEGLSPLPADYAMVNDTIVRKFDIKSLGKVSITLRDVFLMDRHPKHRNVFWLVNGKNLDTKYEITVHRNPCFGLDSDIQKVTQQLADVKKGYASIHAKYGSGKVASDETLTLFHKMQVSLLQQFPRHSSVSPCTNLQMLQAQYNQLVDSIALMSCTVVPVSEAVEVGKGLDGLDATNILARARQIDELASRWLIATDPMERRDIVQQCEQNIKDANEMIKSRGAHTEEQAKAVKTFRAAEQYYRTTCSQK